MAALLAIGLLTSACLPAPPLGTVSPQTADAPQWPMLMDPHVLPDGGRYYLYGSAVAQLRMPIYVVNSLTQRFTDIGAWNRSAVEGMPQKPPWAVDNKIFWAPTVARAANGQYVAFFSAQRANPPNPTYDMCVGRATSSSPLGPFIPEGSAFTCGLDGSFGAIDPALMLAPDGLWYLHVAFTGTPGLIYGMALDPNIDQTRSYWGLGCCRSDTPVYSSRFGWENVWIENPSMAYDAASGTYILAYSAGGDWQSPDYRTGLARCSAGYGWCTANEAGPWLAKSNGRTGIGGLSFFVDFDGSTKAAYASFAAGREGGNPRGTTVMRVDFGNQNPRLFPL